MRPINRFRKSVTFFVIKNVWGGVTTYLWERNIPDMIRWMYSAPDSATGVTTSDNFLGE